MDKDRIAGSPKDFVGKVEGTVGDSAGDAKTQAAGRVREATGTAQNLYGHAKDAAREATDDMTYRGRVIRLLKKGAAFRQFPVADCMMARSGNDLDRRPTVSNSRR